MISEYPQANLCQLFICSTLLPLLLIIINDHPQWNFCDSLLKRTTSRLERGDGYAGTLAATGFNHFIGY